MSISRIEFSREFLKRIYHTSMRHKISSNFKYYYIYGFHPFQDFEKGFILRLCTSFVFNSRHTFNAVTYPSKSILGQQPRRFPFFVITKRQEARGRVAWERGKAGRWKENFMVLSSLSIAIARKTHPFSLPPPRLTWPFSAWTCSKTQGWANNSGNGLIRASYLTIASSIKWINRFRLEGNRILWSHNSPSSFSPSFMEERKWRTEWTNFWMLFYEEWRNIFCKNPIQPILQNIITTG